MTALPKTDLDFTEISRRLKEADLPEADVVVGIATGGIVPASLAAFHLGVPLELMSINLRDPSNAPRRDAPLLLEPFRLEGQGLKVVLVDDVSVSGATLRTAAAQLTGHEVTTLVMKGKGDIVLFPEVGACVNWPWHRHAGVREA